MRTIGVIVAVVIWHLARRSKQTGVGAPATKRDYRIDTRVLDRENALLAWSAVEPIWMLPTGTDHDKKLPPDWVEVTDGQLVVYAVTWVEREVINGGFWQYLYNASADLPTRALDGFQKMGATEYAELLDRAISVFPHGELPQTRNERMSFLPDDPYEDVADQDRAILDELGRLDDRFYDLYGEGEQFYQYIAENVSGDTQMSSSNSKKGKERGTVCFSRESAEQAGQTERRVECPLSWLSWLGVRTTVWVGCRLGAR